MANKNGDQKKGKIAAKPSWSYTYRICQLEQTNLPGACVSVCVRRLWECGKQIQSKPNARDHFPNKVLANHFKRLDCTTWYDAMWYDKSEKPQIRATCARSLCINCTGWQGGQCGMWQTQKCCHYFLRPQWCVYVKYVHSITLCSDFRKKSLFSSPSFVLFCSANRACRELSFVIITILSEWKKNVCVVCVSETKMVLQAIREWKNKLINSI